MSFSHFGHFFRTVFVKNSPCPTPCLWRRHRKLMSYRLMSTKTKDTDTLVNINVGTIGHVDHGKTTLTAAITRVLADRHCSSYVPFEQIDRAAEERRRGITINVAHVSYRSTGRRYSHTDCPGHADYVKQMICGTSQMDGAVLVVAATDGPMPQTREHMMLARQIGLQQLVVFVNKADVASEEMVELVELEMRELLDHYGFDGAGTPFVIGSALLALRGEQSPLAAPSIDQLVHALDEHIATPQRLVDAPFVVPAEQAFSAKNRGTVLVGTVRQGALQRRCPAQIIGYGLNIATTVTDIEVFRQSVERVEAGDHAGFLLRGVASTSLRRGVALVKPGAFKATNHVSARIYMLTSEEGGRSAPITSRFVVMVHSDTWSLSGRLVLPPQREMIMPGEECSLNVLLPYDMLLTVGQQLTVRVKGVTVASGIVTHVRQPVPNTGYKLENCLGDENLPFANCNT